MSRFTGLTRPGSDLGLGWAFERADNARGAGPLESAAGDLAKVRLEGKASFTPILAGGLISKLLQRKNNRPVLWPGALARIFQAG